MFDMVISKGTRFKACGKLDIGIFVKTSHQGTSLSHRSGHFPGVHSSWPLSRVKHFYRICTSREERRKAKHAFYLKLAKDCPEHPMLEYLSPEPTGRVRDFSGKSSWLVLPYHPCWRNASIAGTVEACKSLFADVDGTLPDFLEEFFPRVSWRNGGIHLWRAVQSASSSIRTHARKGQG